MDREPIGMAAIASGVLDTKKIRLIHIHKPMGCCSWAFLLGKSYFVPIRIICINEMVFEVN